MARRTFTDADSELLFRLGNRGDATSALREQWLNDAMFKIGLQYEHREIQAITNISLDADSDNVGTPSGMWWPEWLLSVTDNRPIHLGDRDLIEAIEKPSAVPTKFYTWGSLFVFNALPTVNTAIRVWYIAKPTRWAGSANLPYEENYDVLVLMWATKIALTALRDIEEADAIGKEIAMYVSQQKLPLREQKKNDRQTGLQVRFH